MQNSFMVSTAALLLSFLLQAPRLNAGVSGARMEKMVVQQEPVAQDAANPAIAAAASNPEAEKEYAAGRAAMRRRDWKTAIQAFKRAMELDPEYRDARKRLAEARTILNNEEIEAVAARYYDEGVAAMNRNDVDSALDAFEKVSRINRHYRDLEELYARLEVKQPRPNIATSVAPSTPAVVFSADPTDTGKTVIVAAMDSVVAETDSSTHLETAFASSVKIDSLFQQALAAFERGDWKSAVIAFERIKFVQPNYHDLDDLATVARANLLRQTQNLESLVVNDQRKISLPAMIMVVVTVIGWLGFGLLAVSPAGRARLYRWRGNDVAAALLYEQMLAQKPERFELYPLLAETYLRQKRQDAAALQIFQRVLELDLPTPHRTELHAIITQQERHKGRELVTPRKPRKRKELAAGLEHVNGTAENWRNTNGRFANGEPEHKAGE